MDCEEGQSLLFDPHNKSKYNIYDTFLSLQHEISENLDVLVKICLNIRVQQEKNYQKGEVFVLGFEKVFKM